MNIHILSNSPTRVNSGFGIVTRNLALGLQKLGHSMSVSDMQNIYSKEYWNGITIYPMNSVLSATGTEFYINELKQLTKNLKDSKADVLIIVYPAYDNVIVSNHLHEVFKPTIWYYPVEGENLPKVYTDELKKVERVVPMTKQGKKELERSGVKNLHVKEIYHGFNQDVFHKLDIDKGKDSKELHYCKWKEFIRVQDHKFVCENGCLRCDGKNSGCKNYSEEEIVVNIFGDEFVGKISNFRSLKEQFGVETIFSFIGDNNGKRKKIDRLLNSFSQLVKSEKETMLLLHTLPVSNSGLNLWDYVKKYDINRKNNNKVNLIFCYGSDDLGNSFSERALNILYNISDVNVTCSSAEGFCLPVLESMACRKPQIAPDFSSFSELVGNDNDETMNRGTLANIEGYEFLNNKMKRALVSIKSFKECMRIMHDDKNYREKLGDNGYNFSQNYEWKDICKEFDGLIRCKSMI